MSTFLERELSLKVKKTKGVGHAAGMCDLGRMCGKYKKRRIEEDKDILRRTDE